MLGIIFGNGSSIDDLPDVFFKAIPADALTVGCNRAPLCTRFQEAGFRPKVYTAYDEFVPGEPIYDQMLVGLQPWELEVDLWLKDQTWPISHLESPLGAHCSSGEYGAKIAIGEYGATEIWLVGMDGRGGHHHCTPEVIEILEHEWDRVSRQMLYKAVFKLMQIANPGVKFKVMAGSILYPEPVKELVEW